MNDFYKQLAILPVVSMENQAYSADSCNRCYGLWPLTTALDSMPLTAAMIEQSRNYQMAASCSAIVL